MSSSSSSSTAAGPRTGTEVHHHHGLHDFLHSEKNPFRRNGRMARFAEKLPGFNNMMQNMHAKAGDNVALDRAKATNPLRTNGHLARGAEHVPLLNNLMQGIHSATGKTEAYDRAREANPLGHHGYITKAGEHIPGLADTIVCIHKFRGQDADAERARAFSLRRMVGKKGAITALAELLPGTNLLAAALAEAKGDRDEAKRALNLLRQWRDVASADGALARIAELLPGADIISFGLMVNHGQLAHAVRAICKTRWVDVKATSTAVTLSTGALEDWAILSINTSDLVVEPRAASLAGGLLDVCIHLLDFNIHGEQRFGQENKRASARALARLKPMGLKSHVQDVKLERANEALHGMIDMAVKSSAPVVGFLVDLTNWAVYEWEASSPTSRYIMKALYVMFPPMVYQPLPSNAPSALFAKAFQDSLLGVQAKHEVMPLNPESFKIPERPEKDTRDEPWKDAACRRLPEASAVISCASLQCCLAGVHCLAPVACLAGCAAGFAFAHRKAKRSMVSWLNRVNEGVWEWMSAPVVPLAEQVRGAAEAGQEVPEVVKSCIEEEGCNGRRRSTTKSSISSLASQRSVPLTPGTEAPSQPKGITFEWSQELLLKVKAAEHLRDYFLEEFLDRKRLKNWLHPAVWVLQLFERQLIGFLNDAFGDREVPLVIPIPLPAGVYGETVWLPEIRVMLILWLRFKDERYVSGVKVALVDGLLDQIANVVKNQMLPKDLREVDPRLSDFTEPIDLKFDISLRWALEDTLRIELNDLSVKLGIPK